MKIEKRSHFLINFAYFAVILLLAIAAFKYGIPLLAPFVIAFVIAYALKHPVRFLHRKLHLPQKLAALLCIILFYCTVGALIALLSIKLVSATITLVSSLPTLYEVHALPFFMDILHNIEDAFDHMDPVLVAGLDELGRRMILSLGNLISGVSVRFMGVATGIATAIPGLFIKLVLMIISSIFITMDYDRLTGFCLNQLSDHAKDVFFQIKEYVSGTLWVCIRSYALIISITFFELSIGLSLIKLEHAFVVAFIISIFDILPVLGTGGIMIPWTILTAIRGDYTMALSLLVIYLVITVIRNIIEPKIVGSQLGLHPVVTLCSMFAGAQLMGVVGLFGFPIGLSLLRYLNDRGVIHIFR